MTAVGRPHVVRHVTGQLGDHMAARGVRHRESAERVMAVRRRPRLSAGRLLHARRGHEQPPRRFPPIGISPPPPPRHPRLSEHRPLPPRPNPPAVNHPPYPPPAP